VRVSSALAELDFHIGHIARDGNGLIVASRADAVLPTAVHVDRDDVVNGMKALLRSPRALVFVLTAPFRRGTRGASRGACAAPAKAAGQDINNPWT